MEIGHADSTSTDRLFTLASPDPKGRAQEEIYYLNHSRHLGAQKFLRDPGDHKGVPGIRFSTWAPHATRVEVVMGALWKGDDGNTAMIDPARTPAMEPAERSLIRGGYISDDGTGSHPSWGPFAMTKGADGVWATDPDDPALADFAKFDHTPYMFRVTKDDGQVAYRTDLYSRCQIGSGVRRPGPGEPFLGSPAELDGTVSCSVVVDPDQVTKEFFEPVYPETRWTAQEEYFADPAPDPRVAALTPRDLVIYELHVGALGFGNGPSSPGTLEDALNLLDHLQALGVNAVELLPLSEFGGGGANWGYSTSHFFAIEYSGGGRDQYKWFIRECHRRGIAVILDVVYNHYIHEAERAQWMVDTSRHERNPYYWYEGRPEDYAAFDAAVPESRRGHGGYVENESTGWAPRYWEEMVRNVFISSAVMLAVEFDIDGFRVDQTTSIHSYNRLHANGRPLGNVNAFGGKLLRELTRTLKLVKPRAMVFAEDHSNWPMVTEDPERGGLGFDAVWYSDFYHHLIGDTDKGSDYAKLIKTAGMGGEGPLAMGFFAGALAATGGKKLVYHESHDEAGNGKFTERTIRVAVNGAPLVGETRRFAEARCRFAAGVSFLSAGIPMFLFGEEVGVENKFLYGHVLENRVDLDGLCRGSGKFLFEFYRRLTGLRLSHPGLRSASIDVFFAHDVDRLIAFRRWGGNEEFIIVASLNNRPFADPGYTLRAERIPGGRWREAFNSDSEAFGGSRVSNGGTEIVTRPGVMTAVLPANGFVVLERVS